MLSISPAPRKAITVSTRPPILNAHAGSDLAHEGDRRHDEPFFATTHVHGEAFQSRPDRTVLRSYTLDEMAGVVWLHSVEKLGQPGLSRETCVEVAARMQCSPRRSVNVIEPLVASFYGTAEHTLGRVPTKPEVAELMDASAVVRWSQDTLGVDRNGLSFEHMEYLRLLRTRGSSAEEEIRRALGISNRTDFVVLSEYLTRLNLIRVGPGGRSLTSDGRRYLSASSTPDLRERISRRIATLFAIRSIWCSICGRPPRPLAKPVSACTRSPRSARAWLGHII